MLGLNSMSIPGLRGRTSRPRRRASQPRRRTTCRYEEEKATLTTSTSTRTRTSTSATWSWGSPDGGATDQVVPLSGRPSSPRKERVVSFCWSEHTCLPPWKIAKKKKQKDEKRSKQPRASPISSSPGRRKIKRRRKKNKKKKQQTHGAITNKAQNITRFCCCVTK